MFYLFPPPFSSFKYLSSLKGITKLTIPTNWNCDNSILQSYNLKTTFVFSMKIEFILCFITFI